MLRGILHFMSEDKPHAEQIDQTESDSPFPMHEGIPVFPFVPDRIKETRFQIIEAGDLKTDTDVAALIEEMWLQPEVDFYYFYGHAGGPSADGVLLAARQRGDILMDELERRYYKHPNFQRDYIRIVPHGENYKWDWEREVVDKGPEFWRVNLRLSARKRDELDAWRKVQLEEHFREQARKARYRYDVFLSYSASDTLEAQSLHDKIVAAGGRVFMAPKILQPGDDFAEEIRMALLGSRELWLLVSPSASSSEWVISEWGAAWALGKRIVPILHRCAPESLPARLQKLHCIDLHRVDELTKRFAKS
jgi:hypothetical protein